MVARCPVIGPSDSRLLDDSVRTGVRPDRRLAAEQLAELVAIEKKVKALTKELKELVLATE